MREHCTFKLMLVGLAIAFCNIIMPTMSMGATWADNGSYSISWYKKNQTHFEISTPQEFAGIAYLVNNNFADFYGKKISITSDIDLGGKNWIPIGMGSTVFKGSIEGNNHTISNINIMTSTTGSPYATGLFINIKGAEIMNIEFKGIINVNTNYVGFIAYRADNTLFENIGISCDIAFNHPDIHASTSFEYSSEMAGMVCEANDCAFRDIMINDNLTYTFGSSYGDNCYGNISLSCGGIVANGVNSIFTKCHVINRCNIVINGYVTTSTYTGTGGSFITYGGIAGKLSGNASKVVGCLAENRYFEGNHNVGTFDETYFRFGGIVGYMSKYDWSSLKNCVAIIDSYNVHGHDYSWQAAWYHTNSYFGGVGYEVPKYFAGCYSNNDVEKNITKVQLNRIMENGSTAFSMSQMNTQSFVDELNFYSQLEFDEDYWVLNDGKLCIKRNPDNSAGIFSPEIDSDEILRVYSINGNYIGNTVEALTPGIYIVTTKTSSKKIIIGM